MSAVRAGVVARVVRYELRDVAKSRWLLGYALFFLLATDALLRFGGGGTRALLSITNVVLLLVPLVSTVFGTMYLYDAREFTELLLAQPVRRDELYAGLYLGLALPLALGFLGGLLVPFAVHGVGDPSQWRLLAVLALTGVALTCVFVALAFAIALRSEDRARGLGAAVGVWLLFSLLYDGLVLLGVMLLGDYPLERPLIAAMLANPIDLARVLLIMQFDVSALMGYTGAVFEKFFGNGGIAVAIAALAAWVAAPVLLGARAFRKRDF
ncbi:MAG: ABC transporter permease subunit [Gemmatimonadaceae bacterium]|nr:ABC transporter permease subunit [Gemmatimonadaceae bacterium]NUQ91305.1 ABC transporter permease subunit [Gemmatimonadaceae bacterium]NUR20462.1 ABC transporter permease subunit [Gemmatimonadaceae bacterium]